MTLEMRLAAAFALFAAYVAADSDSQEEGLESLGIFVDNSAAAATFNPLYELSDANFSEFVSTNNAVLVEL